ncbi:MFS transporter [Pseudomonas agarici]|uniref:MFS transporter n=1 Tax=Pseudomonas agarici TaxID=46677 RepID=UPI0002D274FE|nr:MFS transporter [Pseudomonas agarici]NWB90012.1 MFS transporter [Pseudomonas agarici]NWC08210.1 MFS transporter [Pseudomonas agarici]SEK83876.1 Predicted arabinose efflux permease, MFS family [Pseudomonas agarici]
MTTKIKDIVDCSSTEHDDGSIGAFYRSMNPMAKRTFWACSAGWGLDGLDFMIYPLVIGSIMALWNVDMGAAGFAVTATLLFSAIGGWLAGFLSDRIGRVKTLQYTIIWFATFSLLSAFAQNFTQLTICRALLGLGFGGEWAAGAVLMGEAIGAQYRGRAVGCMQSAWAIGWGFAVLAQAVLFSLMDQEIAWRTMYVVGALPAVLVFFLRRYVDEPVQAAEVRRKQIETGTKRPSILEIFQPDILRTTLLASLMSTGLQGGYYAITTWVPTFLRKERELTVVGSSGYLALLIAGSFVGYLVGAWLADRIGRRKLFLVFSVAAIVLVLVYTKVKISNSAMLLLGFPLGFFSSGYLSGVGAFLTELFPTRLRGSGQGFTYNFGRGIGALFPALVGYLSARIGLADSIALFAVLAYSLFFITAFLLPETRGRVLDVDA